MHNADSASAVAEPDARTQAMHQDSVSTYAVDGEHTREAAASDAPTPPQAVALAGTEDGAPIRRPYFRHRTQFWWWDTLIARVGGADARRDVLGKRHSVAEHGPPAVSARRPPFRHRDRFWWTQTLTGRLLESNGRRAPSTVEPDISADGTASEPRGASESAGATRRGAIRWGGWAAVALVCLLLGTALRDLSASRAADAPPRTASPPVQATVQVVATHRATAVSAASGAIKAASSMRITSGSLRVDRAAPGQDIPAGRAYLYVDVSLHNGGTSPRQYSYLNFKLLAAPSGNVYTPRFDPNLLASLLLADTLQAGQSADGKVSFLATTGDTSFSLQYGDNGRIQTIPVRLQR
jgi:hypothetical protein